MRNCISRLKAPGLVLISLVTLTALLSGCLQGYDQKMNLVRPTTSTPSASSSVTTATKFLPPPPGPTLYPAVDPSSLQAAPEALRAILARPIEVIKARPNPLLVAPVAWVDYYLEHPMVMKDGGIYHMYFHGIVDGKSYKIGHAIALSPRGPWKVDPDPVLGVTPGSWDSLYVACPYVMKVGDTFYMWYSGADVGNETKVGVATAPAPGGPFSKSTDAPFSYFAGPIPPNEVRWVESERWVGSVQRVGDQYFMWLGPGEKRLEVHMAMAPRPEGPWTIVKYGVLGRGAQGSWNELGSMGEAGVIYIDGVFYMFVSGFSVPASPPGEYLRRPIEIGLAVSLDGVNWYEYPHNPIVRRGPDGGYDSWQLSAPSVYFEKGVFYVYYTSIGPSNTLPGEETFSLATVIIR